MPNLPDHDEIRAIVISDLHLSHKPPILRSAEPNWYAAMARPLEQLWKAQEYLDCPVILAGDVFDHWKAPPELINFALDKLPPKLWAVPGQHDLPNHQWVDREKSAYWTLVKAGRIRNIDPDEGCANRLVDDYGIRLFGFPWGFSISHDRCPDKWEEDILNVAVVHAYIWDAPKNSYENASITGKVTRWRDKLNNFNVAVFGDNHSGFTNDTNSHGEPNIINCGTVMRRHANELQYDPRMGVIMSDGSIDYSFFDTDQDKYIDIDSALEVVETFLDLKGFVGELLKLGTSAHDFGKAVRRFCEKNGVDTDVEKILLQALNGESE